MSFVVVLIGKQVNHGYFKSKNTIYFGKFVKIHDDDSVSYYQTSKEVNNFTSRKKAWRIILDCKSLRNLNVNVIKVKEQL